MDPRRFLLHALTIVGRDKNPEGFRSAVSRAYYAAFHVARQLLESMSIPVAGGAQGHGDIQSKLGNSRDPLIEQVAYDLNTLHGQRIRADYKLRDTGIETEATASALVNHASDIIAKLDGCARVEERRQEVAKAIKSWLNSLGRNGSST